MSVQKSTAGRLNFIGSGLGGEALGQHQGGRTRTAPATQLVQGLFMTSVPGRLQPCVAQQPKKRITARWPRRLYRGLFLPVLRRLCSVRSVLLISKIFSAHEERFTTERTEATEKKDSVRSVASVVRSLVFRLRPCRARLNLNLRALRRGLSLVTEERDFRAAPTKNPCIDSK